MLPLVRTASQHQCVLLPDTAPGQVEARILERLSEVQALGVRMEDVDGTVIRKVRIHLLKSGEQEAVELRIAHVVVHDLSGSFLNVHVVRGIGKH